MYPFKKDAAAKLLASDNSYAFVLMAILLPVFGDDLFTEDSAILFTDIEDYFNCKLSEESENRINAAVTAMTTDLFFSNTNMFNAITLALCEGDIGDIPEGMMETPDAGECLWAIHEVALLSGEDPSSPEFIDEFTNEVKDYVGSLVGKVAEELDEVDDEVDTIEEAEADPYFESVIKMNVVEMCRQLESIGVDKSKLMPFLAEQDLSL